MKKTRYYYPKLNTMGTNPEPSSEVIPYVDLCNELTIRIKKRKFYEKSDFWLHQTFIWISIISSFSTAVLASIIANDKSSVNGAITNNHYSQIATAILASISATVILVDKNFSFGKRALWNSAFRSELETIQRDLIYKKEKIKNIVDRLNKLDLNMELSFPEVRIKKKRLRAK